MELVMTDTQVLLGKVAIVTGAGNGIGRATAKALAAAGAKVCVSDTLTDDGERTVKEIQEARGEAFFVSVDIANEDQVKNMVESTVSTFGALDILINNAGVAGVQGKRLHELSADELKFVVDINLMGTFFVTKYAIPYFLKAGSGSIVNIASAYGLIGAPKFASYCATKGAIINLTRQLAVDYGPDQIRVNAICPGYVDTSMGRPTSDMNPGELKAAIGRREKAAAMQPLGRQAHPLEVASVAVFLASPGASFMTGSIVRVDGGSTTTFNYGEASN